MSRRYLNLVVHDFTSRLHSIRRIDLGKHLFYRDSEAAQQAASLKRKNKRGEVMGGWKKLPPPTISFQPAPSSLNHSMSYSFSLMGGEDNILYTDAPRQTALYSIDSNFVDSNPSPSTCKRSYGISVSIAQAADPADPIKHQSLYFLDLYPTSRIRGCFEVLSHRKEGWCWDVLPLPPFLIDPETSFADSYAVVDGSAICISPFVEEEGRGTYTFDTVRRKWRKSADWALPFFGNAEYVPELNLWFALSGRNPLSSLSAFDLSSIDSAHPPTPLHTWDYLHLPEDQPWLPIQLRLLNLGLGKFCVATFFGTMLRTCSFSSSDEEDMYEKEYVVFTGLEVKRSNNRYGRLELIKHMSKRYAPGSCNIHSVL